VDIYPRLSMPLHFDGWTFRPEAAVRATWYGKSQFPAGLEQIPVVRGAGTSRTDVETGFDFRPPALERDFSAPWLEHLLGGDVRHTIEPDVSYRYVTGSIISSRFSVSTRLTWPAIRTSWSTD